MVRSICGALVLAVMGQGCFFDEKLKSDHGVVPEELDDGWEIATPESVGLSRQALENIHESLLREDTFPGSLGLLVVKDAKLVWEAYFRRVADRDHYHHVQSVTKSVTSTVLGISRDRDYFDSVKLTVGELFPEKLEGLDPIKQTITLEHLLTMSSGLKFDNINFNLEMYTDHHCDPLRYILEKPLYAEPGEEFYYRNADPQILSYAVKTVTGRTVRDLAAKWLFDPLGIHEYYWQAGHDDGITITGNGLHLKPRDLAKFGQLVLDRGVWRGERIVSEHWVERMTAPQTTSEALDPDGNPFPYGYYWYVVPGGVSAWGTGGQFVLLQPSERLLLVHIARPDTSGLDGSTLREFLELVGGLL